MVGPHRARVESLVKNILNPVLRALGMRALSLNPDAKTPTLYPISMDGNGVEYWLEDLAAGLVNYTTAAYGLKSSNSAFLRAVARTYESLDMSDEYRDFCRSLPMLGHWVNGMRAAMKMKPVVEKDVNGNVVRDDYAVVKRELALYVCKKLELWPGRITWYDHMCLSVLGEMMEKWGSLRLVSQEGMEAWQKKLNEILRLNNGFANAGAIPKAIKAQGEGKVKEYMEARAKDKPSPARWVFEQGLIQQHAYLVDVERVRDSLERAGRTCQWQTLVKYWRRYIVCAALRCRLRARMLVGKWQFDAGAGKIKENRAESRADRLQDRRVTPCRTFYAALLDAHREYFRDVGSELTADDLDEKEKRRQTRRIRRVAYAKLSKREKAVGVNPRMWAAGA